jgi:creatinine amidohydrolase
LTLRHETFINLLLDLCRSLKHHGIEKVAIVNGHGGNVAPGYVAARRARDELGLRMVFISYWSLIPRELSESIIEIGGVPGHAGEFETSLALAIYPELVSEEIPKAVEAPWHLQGFVSDMDEITGNGYTGDPSLATAEKGKRLIEAAVNGLASLLKDFIEKVR